MEQKFYLKFSKIPLGWFELKSTESTLISIRFIDENGKSSEKLPLILEEAEKQLLE